jgi:hypothetical protein
MYQVNTTQQGEKKVTAFVLQTTFADNRQAEEIPPFFHGIMDAGKRLSTEHVSAGVYLL